MDTPLLTTKFFIPPLRQEVVSRPRLIDRLNTGLDCKLTLISAPAGFGKTTLLSEWISTLGLKNVKRGLEGKNAPLRESQSETSRRVAWLSLDERDNDVGRFWTYVVAALQTIAPDLGATMLTLLESLPGGPSLSMLSNPRWMQKEVHGQPRVEKISESERTEAALTTLINEIAAIQPTGDNLPLILVLDDYHLIETAAIHIGLSFLVDHLPLAEGFHLVIASRTDPPLPLSRLRGRGQLNELHMTDLRFTQVEASVFLNQVMKLDLSAQDVAALEARNEGWIVGLQMAALAIMGRSSTIMDSMRSPGPDYQSTASEFIHSFVEADRFIMDYLTDEVLLQQPAFVQTFLLQTSILDRLCSPLCDAVYLKETASHLAIEKEGPSAQDMLERLEASNLFIVPLDSQRKWYRYHHLFTELLRQRLNRRHPGLAQSLHLRASEWYMQQGLIDQAISHALAAPDYERAADLVQQHAGEAFNRGEFSLVLGWMEALPEKLIRSRPLLCILYAYSLSSRQDSQKQIERWIEEAQMSLAAWSVGRELSGADREIYDTVVHHVVAARAITARSRGEPHEKVIDLIREALEMVPENDPGARSLLIANLGTEYLNAGDEQAAERALVDAVRLGESGISHYIELMATYALMIIARRHGRLRHIAELCRKSLASIVEPIERSGRCMPAGGLIYLVLGSVLTEWNDLSGAERALTKGLEANKLLPMDVPLVVRGVVDLARSRIAVGNLEQLPDLADLIGQKEEWHKYIADMVRARIWLIRSQQETNYLQSALLWARERRLEIKEWDWDIWEQLTRSRVLIAHSRIDNSPRTKPDLKPVLDFLDAQLSIVESHGWVELIIETLIVQSLAYQVQGREEEALRALERALILAEPEGYTRIFLDEGVPMERLLYQSVQRGITPEYASKLLAAFETSPIIETEGTHRRPTTKEQKVHPVLLIEPLTQREIEVLNLIAEGLSNREIAQTLHISLSTVKRHNANIYGKLIVNNRTQAVTRARNLGLI